MKKILTVVLVAALAMSLAACASSSNSAATDAQTTTAATTVAETTAATTAAETTAATTVAETTVTETTAEVVSSGNVKEQFQYVAMDFFGETVPVIITSDKALTGFSIIYDFAGNHITASGTIEADGTLTLVDDPTGYATMVVGDLSEAYTEVWIPYGKSQTVTLDFFGEAVDVLFTEDLEGANFGVYYVFAGNTIYASGTVGEDGSLNMTDDPSGFASMTIADIHEVYTDEWTIME